METTVTMKKGDVELITYFRQVNLPTKPFQLNQYERIHDADNFVSTNLMRIGGSFVDS